MLAPPPQVPFLGLQGLRGQLLRSEGRFMGWIKACVCGVMVEGGRWRVRVGRREPYEKGVWNPTLLPSPKWLCSHLGPLLRVYPKST